MKMKKYLLFIVEGKNDKTEIQAIIRAACGLDFFDNYVDAYHLHKNDITAESSSTEKNIIKKLTKIVVDWRQGREEPFQRLAVSDIKKIIHVIDTDGAFIPQGSIIQTDDEKVQYHDDVIKYRDRNYIVGRNRKKARIINKLLATKQIDNIPYELYFASCNMDHVLFDNRNSGVDNKRENGLYFASKCKSREYLENSVYADGICASGSYEDSWAMIREDHNSLKRHTNLNILLDGILE